MRSLRDAAAYLGATLSPPTPPTNQRAWSQIFECLAPNSAQPPEPTFTPTHAAARSSQWSHAPIHARNIVGTRAASHLGHCAPRSRACPACTVRYSSCCAGDNSEYKTMSIITQKVKKYCLLLQKTIRTSRQSLFAMIDIRAPWWRLRKVLLVVTEVRDPPWLTPPLTSASTSP